LGLGCFRGHPGFWGSWEARHRKSCADDPTYLPNPTREGFAKNAFAHRVSSQPSVPRRGESCAGHRVGWIDCWCWLAVSDVGGVGVVRVRASVVESHTNQSTKTGLAGLRLGPGQHTVRTVNEEIQNRTTPQRKKTKTSSELSVCRLRPNRSTEPDQQHILRFGPFEVGIGLLGSA
jgi:hypothetical protein